MAYFAFKKPKEHSVFLICHLKTHGAFYVALHVKTQGAFYGSNFTCKNPWGDSVCLTLHVKPKEHSVLLYM